MPQRYNLAYFVPLFGNYLSAVNLARVSRKNYLSDLRHFACWNNLYLKRLSLTRAAAATEPASVKAPDPTQPPAAETIFDAQSVNEYVDYLKSSQFPVKTINRRLSTLRRFGDFLMIWGLTTANPARGVANVSSTANQASIFDQFALDLREAPEARTSILADVAQFLNVNNLTPAYHE